MKSLVDCGVHVSSQIRFYKKSTRGIIRTSVPKASQDRSKLFNMASGVFNELSDYTPPRWCRHLKVVPKHRITIAMKPTPIHPMKLEGIPGDFNISIKRDDLTGNTLSGNKVRKLEFILGDAVAKGSKCVITSGSTQSNHARTTYIAAKQLGLDCHLVLRDINENCKTVPPSGNFLLMEAGEPHIYLCPWFEFKDHQVEERFRILSNHIQESTGFTPYLIPPGGDSALGAYGYINAWEEMLQQGIQERFDDVVVACGTSGTVCGLAIGNYLTGSKLKVHAINVSRTKENVVGKIKNILDLLGLHDVKPAEIVDITADHIGEGYGKYTQEDIDYQRTIFNSTGIYGDPVYVGKAIKGLVTELNTNPNRFQGKRILFVHTGGLFGMMVSDVANKMRSEKSLGRIQQWSDVFPDKI